MNKVSDLLSERFSQNPLETYFCKQHPPGAEKINYRYPSMTLVMPKSFTFTFPKSFQANNSS